MSDIQTIVINLPWKEFQNMPDADAMFCICHQSDLIEAARSSTAEWIFFVAGHMSVQAQFLEWIDHLLHVNGHATAIVSSNQWLPLLVRRKWLLSLFAKNERVTNMYDMHAKIRSHSCVCICNEWPIKKPGRPTALERYERKILNKWWSYYDDNYLESLGNTVQRGPNKEIGLRQLKKISRGSSFVVKILCKDPSVARNLFKAIYNTNTKYVCHKNVLYLMQNNTLGTEYSADNTLEQALWLNEIRKIIMNHALVIRSVHSNQSCGIHYTYQDVHSAYLVKNKPSCRKKLAIFIDMPGIGDAIRLSGIIREIQRKNPGYRIHLLVNDKAAAVSVYRNIPGIYEIFVCSIRPDPPCVPFILPYLLFSYLSTNSFDKVISFSFDTSAYLSNKKSNFIDVYAAIACVEYTTNMFFINTKKKKDYIVKKLLKKNGIRGNELIIGIQLTASMESKSWGSAQIRQFVEALHCIAEDVAIVNVDYRVIAYDKVLNLGPLLDIDAFFSAIKCCDFFIGVDSAGGHAAAALNIPSVTIYGKEKPRIGNDHRPLNKWNIGIIPPDDCECGEYEVECIKKHKCIDTVDPDIVIYALRKLAGFLPERFKNRIATEQSSCESLWHGAPGHEGCGDDLAHDGMKIIELFHNTPDSLIQLFSFPFTPAVSYYELGIDLWVERNLFEYSSYGMLYVELMLENEAVIPLRPHRLHEGWNLMRFPLEHIGAVRFRKIVCYIKASKALNGKVGLDRIYLTHRKECFVGNDWHPQK